MYNADRKLQFLTDYNHCTSYPYTTSIFNKIAEYEVRLEKDASDFIKSEITSFLLSYGSTSVESLRYRTSILRTYTNWCILHRMSVDNINHYDEINTAVLKQCVNRYALDKKYITKEQLKVYDNELANACDRFLLWAFYEGIKGELFSEISSLTRDDIDQISQTIQLNSGRTLEVSKELIACAIEASEENYYYSVKGNDVFSALLAPSNLVFKPRANYTLEDAEACYSRIVRRMGKIKADLDEPNLTIPRLYNSGIVASIRDIAKELGCLPSEVFGKPEFAAVRKKWQLDDRPTFQLRNMFKEYLEQE